MPMIFRPGNLVFRKAKTEDELKEVYRVTNKIYREAGYITEDEGDVFPDKYSEFSTNFYAARNGTIVGGIRAVHDIIGLPMDEVFDISDVKLAMKSIGGTYVEGSARVTDPMNSPKTNFGIIAIFIQYAVREGITDLLVAMNEPDMKFYEKLGFEKISDKKYYEKVHRNSYPMRLKTDDIRQPYKDMFLQPCENIILDS